MDYILGIIILLTIIKSWVLSFKKESKFSSKFEEEESPFKPTKHQLVFVLNFNGDTLASEVENLRKEITAIILHQEIQNVKEVVIKIYSPGGSVTGYGLAASQILRLKNAKIPVTVCIDEVAASGGYMMACVADKIIAAPFSLIGSIGVVCEFPNFSELLSNIGVNFKQYTAGESKRTVSPYTTPTEENEIKLNKELAKVHDQFKKHVKQFRPNIDIDVIATGECWQGQECVAINLIDQVGVSDDYVLSLTQKYDVMHINLIDTKPKFSIISWIAKYFKIIK